MSEQNNIGNNKRIAKNTIVLYIRMFFVMVVSLYTSRVVLNVLGEQDYGIYNVVGSVVVMFAFLSRTLAGASQRYFAYELGRNNSDQLKKIFSLTGLLYVVIVFIVVFFAETIGVWFVNNRMTIPSDRLYAANCVFHFSVISFCVTILATPYQAIIIAHERMNVYAWVGIVEATLHLCFVLFLQFCINNVDNLIVYGVLMLSYVSLCQLIYVIYSRHNFEEAKNKWYWNSSLAKEMLSYAWWNIFGAVAQICRSQGINLLISVFFMPVINAGRGIAYQINSSLNVFATNFYTAVRPQVTKYYAQGDLTSTFSLIISSSKMSFFLLSFIAIPVIVYVYPILNIWLVNPPQCTGLFARLVIIVALIDSLSNPLMTLMQATGKVKVYQLVTGGLVLLNLPISWIFLHYGYPAEYTLYVAIVMAILCLISRLWIVSIYVKFPVMTYLKRVLLHVIFTSVISWLVCLCLYSFLYKKDEAILNLFVFFLLSVLLTIGILYFVGFTKDERRSFGEILRNRIKR